MEFDMMELLKDFGFPIFAYVAMFWYMKTREDKNDERYDDLQTRQAAQIDRMTDAINNNTLAITTLTERLK